MCPKLSLFCVTRECLKGEDFRFVGDCYEREREAGLGLVQTTLESKQWDLTSWKKAKVYRGRMSSTLETKSKQTRAEGREKGRII